MDRHRDTISRLFLFEDHASEETLRDRRVSHQSTVLPKAFLRYEACPLAHLSLVSLLTLNPWIA